MALYDRHDELPLPPVDAEVHDTVCQYCTVGCGYKVYTWPVSAANGGKTADQNAFGVDFTKPQVPLAGQTYSETMYSTVTNRDGVTYNIAIVPANDSPINLKGDHSSRGGTNALTLYSEDRPTRERLKYPLLRLGDALQPIPWEEAIQIVAGVIKGVYDRHGSEQLTAKVSDHGGANGGFEFTYSTGKLMFSGLEMSNVAIHNRPAYNSEVWGSRDRGVHELHYTAEDARLCDTLVLWGANSYETASVFYTEHMLPNFQGTTVEEKAAVFAPGEATPNMRLVVVDPRRTSSLTVMETLDPERTLHLRPNLGTDFVLANAVARVIWEEGWQDQALIDNRSDLATFGEYRQKSLQLKRPYTEVMQQAEEITGVLQADIEKAAAWIAQPKPSEHRNRTLTIYEKGMIWNYKNYDTIAALVQMNVLGGNIARPGAGCGRQGGHQEGYVRPPYPGERPPRNIDKYITDGNGKFYWVIANNPYLSTPNNQIFRKRIRERTQALSSYMALQEDAAGEPGNPDAFVARILEGVEQTDGLFMVVQDIYETETAADAHLILPAATWGETNLTSINCNSRLLRLYSKFMDAPGDALPDWEIMARTARKLGDLYRETGDVESAARFDGFDWQSDEEVFLAGASEFPDNRVGEADEATLPPETYSGVTYKYLRQVGQQGIQTPVRVDPASGELVGTKRRYLESFGTESGLFEWYGTDAWEGYPPEVAKYLTGTKAEEYPFWMTTGRNQAIWQTAYHDRRLPEKMLTVPLPYVEMHPQDAERLGFEAGDIASLYNEEGNGTFPVYPTESVKPGMVFVMQYHYQGTSNSLTSPYTDPKTTIPWYKGTRVGIRKTTGSLESLKRTTSFRAHNDFS